MPAMADAPLRGYNGRHEWFWEPGDETHVFPLKNLMDMYYNSVGHNATLILGITPDNNGLVPETDVQRMKEFGNEIRKRFEKPLATTSGSGNNIDLIFPGQKTVNQVVLMEDISKGERVRKFRIEGLHNGKWITLFEGTCIGHKLITTFDDIEISRARLRVLETVSKPYIKMFNLYRN